MTRYTSEGMLILIVLMLMGLLALSRFASGSFAMEQAGSISNDGESGTQTFFSWMGQRGHRVRIAETRLNFEETAVLFIIAPTRRVTAFEAEQINQWVRNGGTLFLVQGQNNTNQLMERFGIRSRRTLLPVTDLSFNLPTLNWPLVGSVDLRARDRYRVACGSVAVHLGSCDEAHLATFGWGAGQVVLLSSFYPLSDAGLKHAPNARLMQNVVELVTLPGQTILVDETHRAGWGAFWRSRATLALLATAVLIVAYMLWQNQPFNNPIGHANQVIEPESMGSTNMFINHLSNAQKELDPQRTVREFFWRQVKRKYANRHGIDYSDDDRAFLHQLRKVEEEETIGNLIYIMTTMTKPQIDDLELMHWMSVTLNHLEQD